MKNAARKIYLYFIYIVMCCILLLSGIVVRYRDHQKYTIRNNPVAIPKVNAATPVITKLYFQNGWAGRPGIVANLPSYYAAFINATYDSDQYIPGKTHEILGQYVESTNALETGAHEPNYPIYIDMLKDNELTFVHSTNPAELTVIKGVNVFNLYWKFDERYADYANLEYTVYRNKGANINAHALWDQSWKTLSGWESIAVVKATSFSGGGNQGKFLQYADSGYLASGNTCYLIKTKVSGQEKYYSLPVCKNFATEPIPQNFYFTHSHIVRTAKTPIPGDNLFSNNTYEITVKAVVSAPTLTPQVILYGNEGACFKVNQNQCAYNFHELARYNLTKNGDAYTASLTLRRPYLMYKGGTTWTEEPVFRITATSAPVSETQVYPYDGGYLVLGANNKLQNRYWTGYPANPASSEWQEKMIQVVTAMKSKGYNAVFLDNWGARLFDITSTGNAFDSPAIEFFYPANWTTISGFTDPAVLALHKLAMAIKSALPGFFLLGNSLYPFADSVNTLQYIDGGMFEGCIHPGSTKVTGQDLVNTFAVIESALSKGKAVVCFSSFYDGGINGPSPFDPDHRLYTLASYLLIAQHKSTGKTYYGHAEHNPTWGTTVNQYPEYLVDIGNPVSARESLGTYIWKRTFDNGLVYVNAGTTAITVTLPAEYSKMIIDGIVTNRNAAGAITSANPGVVRFEKIASGSQLTLAPGTGLILQKNPNIPASPPTITPTPSQTPTVAPTTIKTPTPTSPGTKSGDLNGDTKVDIFDYNTLISNFGKTGSPGFIPSDIDKNGKVDIFDYNVLIGNFGK